MQLLAFNMLQANWLEALGPIILLLFYIARHVLTAIGEQKEEERLRREVEQAGDQPELLLEEPALAGQPAQDPQQELRSEVEDFVRRVKQQRQGPEAGAAPAPKPARKQPIDPFEEPPRRRRPKPRQEASQPKAKPTPQARGVAEPEKHEMPHLPESQLAERAAHLGDQIAHLDERVEARLQSKFDTNRGSEVSAPAAPGYASELDASESASPAALIRAKLSQPAGRREAIVLAEILRPVGDQLSSR